MDKNEKKEKIGLKDILEVLSVIGIGVATTAAICPFLEDYVIKKLYDDAGIENEKKIEHTLKSEKIQEYKEMFLKTKGLSGVFNIDELNRMIDQNVTDVSLVDYKNKNIGGTYSTLSKKIRVSRELSKKYFDDVFYHELTHATLTHDFLKDDKDKGTTGTGFNEGLTEYISQKLIKKTNYDNYRAYHYNVRVIEILCMAYGEEKIFKSLKDGQKALAKILEKDGLSYTELSGILDEVARISTSDETNMNQEKYQKEIKTLGDRATNIAGNFLAKKFEEASPNEKIEIAKRVRTITAEQSDSKRNIRSSSNSFCNMNAALYNEYLKGKVYSDKLLDSEKNISGIAGAFLMHVFDKMWEVNVDDIDNIQINTVKDKSGKIVAAVATLGSEVLDFKHIIKQDKETVYYKNSSNLRYTDVKKDWPNYVTEFEKLVNRYKPITDPIISSKDGEKFTSIAMETRNGIKFFEYDENTNSLEELHVKPVCKMKEAIVEEGKDKKIGILKKIHQKVNNIIKPNNMLLLDTAKSNVKTPDNMFVEEQNFSKGKKQEPIQDEDIIATDNTKTPDNMFAKEKDFSKGKYKSPMPEENIMIEDNTKTPDNMFVKEQDFSKGKSKAPMPEENIMIEDNTKTPDNMFVKEQDFSKGRKPAPIQDENIIATDNTKTPSGLKVNSNEFKNKYKVTIKEAQSEGQNNNNTVKNTQENER